jgi:hypothetical protein
MFESQRAIWGIRYHSMPQDIDVTCPRCQSIATFSSAFVFVSSEDNATVPIQHPGARRVQWGSDFLEERFPNEFPWKDPDNPFTSSNRTFVRNVAGVSQCVRCCTRTKHVLDWPNDAYFKVTTRAGELWAWNRTFLVAARNYIQSIERDLSVHGAGTFLYLRAIPKVFLLVSNRDNVIRRISRLLEEAT